MVVVIIGKSIIESQNTLRYTRRSVERNRNKKLIYFAAFCVTRSYFINDISMLLFHRHRSRFSIAAPTRYCFIWSVSTYLEHFSLVHLFAAAVLSQVVLLPYATETVDRLRNPRKTSLSRSRCDSIVAQIQKAPDTCPRADDGRINGSIFFFFFCKYKKLTVFRRLKISKCT